MSRRDLLIFSASAPIARPLQAAAQQKATPMIGFLSSASAEAFAPFLPAFRGSLEEAGYVEGAKSASNSPERPVNTTNDRHRSVFFPRRDQIARLAAVYSLPTIYSIERSQPRAA